MIVTGKNFNAYGSKFIAKKSGALVKSKFYTTKKGNKVYCDKNGVVTKTKSAK